MTSMAVMPRATAWTVDDLEHLPDDGLQYELLDGILLGLKNVTRPLALAVEALSQSTRRKDHVLKYSKYANSDVESSWIVDPAGPSIVAFDLIDRAYVEVATAQSTEVFSVAKPYPVSFVPDDLLDL
jgi:hypothetical protein